MGHVSPGIIPPLFLCALCRHEFLQGHVAVLKEARKLGTFLLVGIQSDETVNSMRGQNLPIMNLHERALGVLSCRYVDEVTAPAAFFLV